MDDDNLVPLSELIAERAGLRSRGHSERNPATEAQDIDAALRAANVVGVATGPALADRHRDQGATASSWIVHVSPRSTLKARLQLKVLKEMRPAIAIEVKPNSKDDISVDRDGTVRIKDPELRGGVLTFPPGVMSRWTHQPHEEIDGGLLEIDPKLNLLVAHIRGEDGLRDKIAATLGGPPDETPRSRAARVVGEVIDKGREYTAELALQTSHLPGE